MCLSRIGELGQIAEPQINKLRDLCEVFFNVMQWIVWIDQRTASKGQRREKHLDQVCIWCGSCSLYTCTVHSVFNCTWTVVCWTCHSSSVDCSLSDSLMLRSGLCKGQTIYSSTPGSACHWKEFLVIPARCLNWLCQKEIGKWSDVFLMLLCDR